MEDIQVKYKIKKKCVNSLFWVLTCISFFLKKKSLKEPDKSPECNNTEIIDETPTVIPNANQLNFCKNSTNSPVGNDYRSAPTPSPNSPSEQFNSGKQQKTHQVFVKNRPLDAMIELPQKTKNMHTYRLLDYGSFNRASNNATTA